MVRIRRIASTPSMPGSTMSISTASKAPCASRFTASSPRPMNSAWWPSSVKMVLSTTRPNGLSSTLSTRSAAAASASASPFALRDLAGPAASSDTVNVKVAPPPRRGATEMSPPIPRASCFTEDSPKPAPPKREAMVTLAWVNGRNSRLISAMVRPMPLSDTAKATPTLPFILSFFLPLVGRQGATTSATPPWSVNFTALSMRFSSAARRRTGSPTTSPGSFSESSTWAWRPLAAARPASESPALRASARRSNRSCRSAPPPFPAPLPVRAASTNRVARLARCSAPALMVSAQRRSRSPRSEVASRSLIARMPVRGVRTSWAKAASAAWTTSGATTLVVRLRTFPAAPDRFRGNRLDVRVVRAGRVFAAIIPLRSIPFEPPGRQSSMARRNPWSHGGVWLNPRETSPNPTRARMPTGDAPASRNSRKPVERLDFDSFRPASSRIWAWWR
ncbi:hypothetical protein NK6_4855 [Bradyrhizobium diazoefficiens]|uniref:Uncharacterized protein n=1 Tax=Bradyrhizobium diazoefficiens TaxID=1355477 RepID=A0A0E3VUU5_9BRAD|nr:hypothetical protein NK6_4855 [Bradyrhizobium diazoefficiens]